MTDVRTLLHDLADEAPAAHGADTADRAVDAHRRQDRRRLRWAGVAAAAALVVAVTPAVLDRTGPSDTAATAVGTADLGLYDLPTRGSLAGDGDLVAQALAASWDDGIPLNDAGDVLDPLPDTRQVAFLGEVPGGQVWALVLGRTGTQLAQAWFADVDASDGVELQLVQSPQRTYGDVPLALADLDGATGPLVVVGLPGDRFEYAPDGSGGEPDRSVAYGRLAAEDGVAVAEVVADGDSAGWPSYRVVRDDVVVLQQAPSLFRSSEPLGPYETPGGPPVLRDPVFAPLAAQCLTGRGWNVTTSSDGTVGLDFPLGQVLVIEFLDAVDACAAEIGYP